MCDTCLFTIYDYLLLSLFTEFSTKSRILHPYRIYPSYIAYIDVMFNELFHIYGSAIAILPKKIHKHFSFLN